MPTHALPKRVLSKSKFAMYLRTKCDRELYLSLFSNRPSQLAAAGIPPPLKSRTDVQLITASGREFEYEQYDILLASIPTFVLHKSAGRASVDPSEVLRRVAPPALILQPEIKPEEFRDSIFRHLNVPSASQPYIPEFSGLRPDVLLVREQGTAQYAVQPDGSRYRIQPGDARLPISVIDLKNIAEANATYSAEVCLYALFLANWLATQGAPLTDRYFVSDHVYLWRHVEMPTFTALMSTKAGGDPQRRFTALLKDLQDGLVNYLVFMPSVRKFFVEDVPRVVQKGDTEGWNSLEYHVNPRCGSCDWLGNKSWLNPDDKKIFDANPQHYCFQNAEVSDHLSQLPILSRGAARVLVAGGHPKISNLVDIPPTDPSLRRHTILKRDRKQLGLRARALVDNEMSLDSTGKVPALARSWNAEYDVVVNFDAGSGFLTGIALRAVLSAPYGKAFGALEPLTTLKVLGEKAFVVPKDNLTAEWTALQAFLDHLGDWAEQAEAEFSERGWGRVRTQICFWEPRQYEELCNAFARHLLRVLGAPSKAQRALAWVFPAERLMERENAICPSIVFIRDVISSSLRLPLRFATTLLGAAEHYHHPKLAPRRVDNYYREPLGEGIPRERIYAIWKSPTATVRLFGRDVSIADAIDRYGSALRAQAWGLGSITAQLRRDLKNALQGNAPVLPLSIPQGMRSVAHDAKLWMQWTEVSAAAAETVAALRLIGRAESLEASYDAVILAALEEDHGGYEYTFRVSEDSTEAKIGEGDKFCAIGIAGWPGFPLQTPHSLGLAVDSDMPGYYAPIHRTVVASVKEFDRIRGRARVAFRPRFGGFADIFDDLMDAIPIGEEPIYLTEGLPPDDTESTRSILRAVGNPKCAETATEALEAMGKSTVKKMVPGTDRDTPIARVLWAAGALSLARVRSEPEAKALADWGRRANPTRPLNSSQYDAVRACAAAQLSIVWGPPGTGKTDTLVAFLHGAVREGKQRKILLSGPNYRTVEELASRLAESLDRDLAVAADFFWVYSRYRDLGTPPIGGAHLNVKAINLEPGSEAVIELIDSATDGQRTTIIATTAHIVDRVLGQLREDQDSVLSECFDLVVLDESSQIPVTLALRPLAGLRPAGQLVVAGDHLQMPPIQELEPPLGAEYLVSSIQTYLIRRFQIPVQRLLVNYRSNGDLVEYAKSLGYPRELEAYEPTKGLRPLRSVAEAVGSLPGHLPKTDAYVGMLAPSRGVVALIHHDSISSQANELEAGLVGGLAFCVRRSMARQLDTGGGGPWSDFDDDGFFDVGVGIVTPHKAQKALVVRTLLETFPDADPAKVYGAVDTVERFQGGERQTIIVSFAVGDTDVIEGEEEFLLQMERTNVAVSRAQAKCIVLMPESLAYHLPRERRASDTSIAIKSYVEEFCVKREKMTVSFKGDEREAELRWR